MARDGSGNYNLPAGQPVVAGTVITSGDFNTLTTDLAAALTGSMTRDGQGLPTTNIPFGGFRLTGVANAVGAQDATTLTQVQGLISSDRKTYNRIINGGMAIDQRNEGASQTITFGAAIAYTVDQWYAWCSGVNCTGTRVAGTGRDQYRYQFTGAAGVTAVGFAQKIEQADTYDLVSQSVTLGVDLAMSAGGTVTWTIYRPSVTANTFGTAAPPGGTRTSEATGTFTVTSTVTRYTITQALSASANTGLEIVLSIGALGAGATFTIGDAQIELGTAASAFERRSFADELQKCQRFYAKSYSLGVTPGAITADGHSVDRQGIATVVLYGLNASLPVQQFTVTGSVPSVKWYSQSSGTVNRIRNVTSAADAVVTGTSNNNGQRSTGYPTITAANAANDIMAAQWTSEAVIP